MRRDFKFSDILMAVIASFSIIHRMAGYIEIKINNVEIFFNFSFPIENLNDKMGGAWLYLFKVSFTDFALISRWLPQWA